MKLPIEPIMGKPTTRNNQDGKSTMRSVTPRVARSADRVLGTSIWAGKRVSLSERAKREVVMVEVEEVGKVAADEEHGRAKFSCHALVYPSFTSKDLLHRYSQDVSHALPWTFTVASLHRVAAV